MMKKTPFHTPMTTLLKKRATPLTSSTMPLVAALISALLSLSAQALPHRSQKFAVASPSPYAADIAAEIATAGGNLFDQTVAIALSMAVTHPYYASLGGGGFAIIRKSNPGAPATIEVLDFREVAPKATSRATFIGKDPKAATDGGLASGVPGVPAGLSELHKRYGKLPWKRLFAPAIRLAEQGFPVSGEWASLTARKLDSFNEAGKEIFGRVGWDKSKPPVKRYEPLLPGDTLKQPKLAAALKRLRDRGAADFYNGMIAQDIVKAVKDTDGVMELEDLKSYKVAWREPLRRTWRGYQLALMPPPSSGGLIIAQGLELVDRLEKRFGIPQPLSTQEAHLWAESLKLAFAARGQMGDPMGTSSMSDLSVRLLTPDRLDRLAGLVATDRALEVKSTRSPDLKEAMTAPTPAKEKTETTHFSIADQEGNAVAFTVTLNGSYGSSVVSPRFGIAMNDEMDDFATQPGVPNQYGLIQGEANAVAPGKRPLSSMSPTIIEKDGRFVATLGAPGGPRIPSAVFQAIIRTLTQEADAEEAVVQPRVHHQFLPDTLFFDTKKIAPEIIANLKKIGHNIAESSRKDWIAKVYLVKQNPDGILEAAADPRGEAAAGGR
ncbi:MAG: gamma-glutamyltransferase [Bdellovibrionales bacterium]|jgi:gamma-glutamyltranspeptidase/glutathione hydrolase|nr:gamma-glutamyltransferase [Bdellovibrionales bacterium]